MRQDQRMPFLPSCPGGPFGAWLKQCTGGDPIGELATSYADDIGAEATPRDVLGIIRSQQATGADCDTLLSAVRQWLSETIPLSAIPVSPAVHDDNLVMWPDLEIIIGINPPATDLTCVMCCETLHGPFTHAVFAKQDEHDKGGFICRPCAAVIPPRISNPWNQAAAADKRHKGGG
jgi:hypothetical protein